MKLEPGKRQNGCMMEEFIHDFLVETGVCEMKMVTLPSFQGGREVRSHQEVQGSPAIGSRK